MNPRTKAKKALQCFLRFSQCWFGATPSVPFLAKTLEAARLVAADAVATIHPLHTK